MGYFKYWLAFLQCSAVLEYITSPLIRRSYGKALLPRAAHSSMELISEWTWSYLFIKYLSNVLTEMQAYTHSMGIQSAQKVQPPLLSNPRKSALNSEFHLEILISGFSRKKYWKTQQPQACIHPWWQWTRAGQWLLREGLFHWRHHSAPPSVPFTPSGPIIILICEMKSWHILRNTWPTRLSHSFDLHGIYLWVNMNLFAHQQYLSNEYAMLPFIHLGKHSMVVPLWSTRWSNYTANLWNTEN